MVRENPGVRSSSFGSTSGRLVSSDLGMAYESHIAGHNTVQLEYFDVVATKKRGLA